jgi:hypothetical protein
LDPASIAHLAKGQDSGSVRRVLGDPHRIDKGANGKILEIYETDEGIVRANGRSRVLEMRTLHVLYDASGSLEKFAHHTNRMPAVAGTKWRAGVFLSDDDLVRIVKDATTAAELVEYFGPPTGRGLNLNGDEYLTWEYQEGRGVFRKGRQVNVVINMNSVVTGIYTREITPEKGL